MELHELKKEFQNIELLKIFEIEVIDKATKETDYIIFDISVDNDSLKVQHIALSIEEQQSDKIAFISIELDDCFTLDENLQSLYESCIEKITESDFYKLA